MNEYLQIIVMAVFQGVAEFLPISSSGHLELFGALFGIREDERLTLSIILHAGTLLSMLLFYRREIIAVFTERQWRLIMLLIIGTIPAGVGGVALKICRADSFFHNLYLVGGCFIVTAILLLLLKKTQAKEQQYISLKEMSCKSALFIGIVQMVAILPGISRSGSTIFAGAKCRLSPSDNAQFSFFLAMAAIGGASLLEIISLAGGGKNISDSLSIGNYITGFVFAFASGYLSLMWLVKLLKSRKLGNFCIYLFLLGAATLIFNIWK